MSTFHIKLLAVITMVIDHVGLFFFPDLVYLRVIGRLSFPLFAWLIANGAHHTRNLSAYTKRIFILAIVSQIPFTIANLQHGLSFWYFNVLFTFTLSLLAIAAYRETTSQTLRIASIGTAMLLALGLSMDYGATGVLTVLLFYHFFQHPNRLAAWYTALTLADVGLKLLLFTIVMPRHISPIFYLMELAGLLSLFVIARYHGERGPKWQYAFYVFYPVQYIIISIAQFMLD